MKQVLHRLFLAVLVLGTVSGIVACSKNSKTSGLQQWLGGDERIFSNRPQTQETFLALLKLKSPALLIAAEKVDGTLVIDSESAQAVELEQTQLIDDLKALSSDIQVLYRYRLVLNGVAIVAPISLKDKIKEFANVAYVENMGHFGRPVLAAASQQRRLANAINERNSVKFIGADKVHTMTVTLADGTKVPVTGRGVSVGVIDTGIDYTHSMLGGEGTKEAYKAIDPSQPNAAFPNTKVVGGIDLVGTVYDSGSGDFKKRIPLPDLNPLDEGGHGTHVAGTVAGIGDGVETYSGVAPDADLYAIKVFGADGSTGDAVVIAGLEYAADPNKDGVLDDQLNVVNLSLGSSYGIPHVLYNEAMANLSNGGTFVVASAGNEGPNDYIVGAPSTVDEALSVAASIDNGDHNWQFGAVKFTTVSGDKIVEAIEATITKPIEEAGPVVGKLVYIGVADKELSDEVKAAVKGQVALIDRGIVTFAEKIERAANAGAIGVVVANNQPGSPMTMGGEGKVDIPAIMVSQEIGNFLKAEMKKGEATIAFQTPEKIEKPELIDTLTDFSSQGPRSVDGFFKPEISAPGANVISAEMGGGTKPVKMSGTSMAAPHMAGVMALMVQKHPGLNSAELKSVVMGTAVSIKDAENKVYLLSRQGAGRVDAYRAALATLISLPAAVSLGEVSLENQAVFAQTVTFKNISDSKVEGELSLQSNGDLELLNPQSLSIEPGASKAVVVKLAAKATGAEAVKELDGLLKVSHNGTELLRVPVLAVAAKVSQVHALDLKVQATSVASSKGAIASVKLDNSKGFHAGEALLFNLLGQDQRKQDPRNDPFMSRACDLESVGYRIVTKELDGQKYQILQVAGKLYEPMTTWNPCQFSVLIDADNDNVPDQELAGMMMGDLAGISTPANESHFASILLDAGKTREIRKQYEQAAKDPKNEAKEDYTDAVVDLIEMKPWNHSTVIVLETTVSNLALRPSGELAVKVASLLIDPSAVESDDFLGSENSGWKKISVKPESQPFYNLPEVVTVKAGSAELVEFTKGSENGKILALYPKNRTTSSSVQKDDQSQILKAKFGN